MKFTVEYPNNFITLRVSHPVERFPVAFASLDVKTVDADWIGIDDFSGQVKIGVLCGLLRHPDFRGFGICKLLLDERISLAEGLGCSHVYTAVYYKREGLINFYMGYGFEMLDPLSKEYVRLVMRL